MHIKFEEFKAYSTLLSFEGYTHCMKFKASGIFLQGAHDDAN